MNNSIKAMIIDMDGVLWRDTQPLVDLSEVFRRIASKGIDFVLATNNATRTISHYVERIGQFGFDIVPEKILTSAVATVEYLADQKPRPAKIYPIGEVGLITALEEKGFEIGEQGADVVVVGLDRQFTYQQLKTACLLVRGGAKLVGTNPDLTFPVPEGLAPGAGSLIRAVEAAAGVEAEIIGKPGVRLFQQALNRLQSTPEDTLVIGDRLETDIKGGQSAGCITCVVLSGVATKAEAAAWRPKVDFTAANLAELVDQL